jgi:hypothetical protein
MTTDVTLPATPMAALVEVVTAFRDDDTSALTTALESLDEHSFGAEHALSEVLIQAVVLLVDLFPPEAFTRFAMHHAQPWAPMPPEVKPMPPKVTEDMALESVPFADWNLARDVVRDLGYGEDVDTIVGVAKIVAALRRFGVVSR